MVSCSTGQLDCSTYRELYILITIFHRKHQSSLSLKKEKKMNTINKTFTTRTRHVCLFRAWSGNVTAPRVDRETETEVISSKLGLRSEE